MLYTFKEFSMIKEDVASGGAPMNSVGGGAIAGIGVGPQGEPGVDKKKKKTPIIGEMNRRKKPVSEEDLVNKKVIKHDVKQAHFSSTDTKKK